MTGCIEMRKFLAGNGFAFIDNYPFATSDCKWLAYRQTVFEARRCECNDDQTLQVNVKPFLSQSAGGEPYERASVEIRGEYAGLWYHVNAYDITRDELINGLADIERRLVAAWNALATGAAQ